MAEGQGGAASRAAKNEIYKKLGKWKYIASKKLKGAYGETDYEKKKITINKEAAKKDVKGDAFSRKESTLINTLVHETLHKNHPKMHEKTVRKQARKLVAKMSKKSKAKLYSKLA